MSYVYLESERNLLWTVGFYDPNGDWQPESDHRSPEAAASRTHWLNGGKDHIAAAAVTDPFMPSDGVWQAHPWARFSAVDANGLRCLYETSPDRVGNIWLVTDGENFGTGTDMINMTNLDWRESLRERPAHLRRNEWNPKTF